MRFRPVGKVLYAPGRNRTCGKFPPEGAATGSVSDKLPAWALVAAVGTGAAVDGSQGESAWGRRGRKQGSNRVETRALAQTRPLRGTGFTLLRPRLEAPAGTVRKGGNEGRVDGGRCAPDRPAITRCRFR